MPRIYRDTPKPKEKRLMPRIDYSKLDLATMPDTTQPTKQLTVEPEETEPTQQPAKNEQPLLLRTSEAAALLGIGRTNLYRLINDGHLRSIKVYGRRLIPREALTEFINNTKEAA